MSLFYREQRPREPLRRLVECLWIASDPVPCTDRPPEHIIPDACPEIIVQLGDAFSRQVDGVWVEQPRAFLAGTLTRPWALRAGTRLSTCGIRFRPGAITALFPIDMATATDRELPLAAVCGEAAAHQLTAALTAAGDDSARFAAADDWLGSELTRRNNAVGGSSRERITAPAVDLLLDSAGQLRIAELATHLAVSRRSLERAFARDLGIRPKLFARIIRLSAALANFGREQREPAALVALDAGYFDQAHLLRDFRAVVGRRPSASRDGDGELARHFTDPDRLLEMLAGE